MPTRNHFRSEFNARTQNKATTEIEEWDIAASLMLHEACDTFGEISHDHTVEITRADGQIMAIGFDYDAETDEPIGWTTSKGPNHEEMEVDGGGESTNPEQVIDDMWEDVYNWLEQCDMSYSELENLAHTLYTEDFQNVEKVTQQNDEPALVVTHENDHYTHITWNMKTNQFEFTCSDHLDNETRDGNTDDEDEIIDMLNAQAEL